MEDGFNDSHVLDGVFNGNGNFSIFQNSLGKRIPLQRVLIADGKGFCLDAAAGWVSAAVDKKTSRPVGRRVEWNFNFDTPSGTEEMDALVGDQLRAAGEDGLAAGEIENCRSEAVDLCFRIAVDTADDARRLLCECKP